MNHEITVNADITLTAQYAEHTCNNGTRKDDSYVTAPNCITDGTAVYVCDHIQYATIPTLDKVTITVSFTTVNDQGETVVVGTETKVVAKGSNYDVTEEVTKIPNGYVQNGDPTGNPVSGTADSDKTVIVPVRAIVYAAAAEEVRAVYDGQTHPVTDITFTKDGVTVEADEGTVTIAYATMARSLVDGEPKNAGRYTATISAKIDGHEVSATAEVTITPAPLTVKTDSASKTYDGTALTAGGTVTGLVNGETVNFAATGSQTAVGHSENGYKLTFDGTALEGNYSVVNVELGTLTVNRRPTPVDPDPVDPDPVDPVVDIDDPIVPLGDEPIVDIDDPDVPLAELPEQGDSLVEILDVDVPLADVPKTGDLSLLWHMITLLSAAGLMTLTLLERRQRREK